MAKYVLLAVSLLTLTGWHPLHVSVCEIDYDRERKALEITQRIFYDDLELELRKETGNETLDIVDGVTYEELDGLLEQYIQRHVSVFLEGKVADYDYLGHELEGDAVFCYFEITKVRKLNRIAVKNDILLNYYDDQINIVHISEKDKVRSMRLERKSPRDEIIF